MLEDRSIEIVSFEQHREKYYLKSLSLKDMWATNWKSNIRDIRVQEEEKKKE